MSGVLSKSKAEIIKKQISGVIAKYPTLNSFGFGAFEQNKLSFSEKNAKIAEGQNRLLDGAEEVAFVVEWLQDVEKTKGITQRTSYGLKHDAERSRGAYISNGAFIAGAVIAGFKIGCTDGPNCCFNMSLKSLKRKTELQEK